MRGERSTNTKLKGIMNKKRKSESECFGKVKIS